MADEDTDFGRELIASMQEAAAILRGEKEPPSVHLPPGSIDLRALRNRLGLTRLSIRRAVRPGDDGLYATGRRAYGARTRQPACC